jgi:hypothetical protein
MRSMGLLHKDEPVTDATVNCPGCSAMDWVVRTPRLGGQAKIVCRACGHDEGDYFPIRLDAEDASEELGRDLLERAAFPVFAPAGLPWEPSGWVDQDEVRSVTVVCEEPWVTVTTEPVGASEPVEALRDAMADVLGDEGLPDGRSHAAYLLEATRMDERIDEQVDDLAVEAGTLRVEGVDVGCTRLSLGAAWAAHAVVGEVAVIAAAADLPLGDVSLERAK